jgi:4-amino-4-deoxy-L-arabinose transferase-like glycosyltransferase
MIKRERVDLAILLLVAVLLSIYLVFQTYVISLDGAFQYIPMAKDFASGLFKEGFQKTGQQPLYPLLISSVSCWTKDFELAGMLVSSFFGVLIILPVYYLGKWVFGQQVAFISVLLLIIHPHIRRFSADVLKESTYLFFLATAIWFSWKTIQGEKRYPYLYLWIPFLSVLTYLVRPDGVEIFLVVFFYILFIKKFSASKEKWTIILLLILSSALLFLPFLIHLKETTGVWTLSRAKTISGFLGLGGMGDEVSLIHKILFSLKKLNTEIFSIFHPLSIFLMVIGLLKRRFSHFRTGEGFLFLFCVLHYAVLFLLALNITEWSEKETVRAVHLSGRHVLPFLIFSIYWVGEGILVLYDWIYKKMESKRYLHPLESKKSSMVVWGTLFILILAIVLPKTLKPQRYERLTEKKAGIWIKAQSGKGVTIFTTLPRVAYYADGKYEYVDFNKDTLDKIKASMVEREARYLVLRGRELTDYPEIAKSINRDFIEIIRYEEKGIEKVVIYKRLG